MAKLSKKKLDELNEKLLYQPKNIWETSSDAQRKEIMALAERYKRFLSVAKTERLAVTEIKRQALEADFAPLGAKAKGKRWFLEFRGKMAALVVLGKEPATAGLRIIGAHLDAPRLDLKMNPLYEDQGLAFLKTHYYGGVKKYQWLARPMALLGVVCAKDGRVAPLALGEDPDGPVFTVLDVLPHLSRRSQGEKKVNEAFEAERMNLLIAGLPLDSDEKGEKVKLAVLQRLYDEYGLTEHDLISAELEIVPAGPARDVGLDRAFVGGYGQDDRAAAFAAMAAILDLQNPLHTAVALFVDKEEVGSEGATGARSRAFELMISSILEAAGQPADYLAVRRVLAASQAISADAVAALDPDYPELHEKRNAALLGHGVGLSKYTGSGGKYSTSDADAEYVAWIRSVWDGAGAPWQVAAMGKIDEGGGGTIAKFLAEHGMEVIDAGPPLLSMHSPFEISHKADIHAARQAFLAFYQAAARRLE